MRSISMNSKGRLQYNEFVDYLTRFKRSSILGEISSLLWSLYSVPNELSGKNDIQAKHLVESYSGRIAAIIVARGVEYATLTASRRDIINFCSNFVDIEDAGENDESIILKFQSALKVTTYLKEHCNNKDLLNYILIVKKIGRIARAQNENRAFFEPLVVRSWVIAQNFFDANEEYKEVFFNKVGIYPIDVFRCGWCLFAMAVEKKGRIDLFEPKIEQEVKDKWNVDLEKLRLLAAKWSQSPIGYKKWHDEVDQLSTNEKKYYPCPLRAAPLVELNGYFKNANEHTYFIPDPSEALWKISNAIENFLAESLERNEYLTALNFFGPATSLYVHDLLSFYFGKKNIVKVDELIINGPKADFLVLVGNIAIVVEVKKSISNKNNRTNLDPEGEAKIFDRIAEGYVQCANTIASVSGIFPQIKRFVSLVCVNEHLIVEAQKFNMFAFNSGFLKSLNLKDIELISLADLEYLADRISAQEIVSAIFSKWNGILHDKTNLDLSLSQFIKKKNDGLKKLKKSQFLDQHRKKLLPY